MVDVKAKGSFIKQVRRQRYEGKTKKAVSKESGKTILSKARQELLSKHKEKNSEPEERDHEQTLGINRETEQFVSH